MNNMRPPLDEYCVVDLPFSIGAAEAKLEELTDNGWQVGWILTHSAGGRVIMRRPYLGQSDANDDTDTD